LVATRHLLALVLRGGFPARFAPLNRHKAARAAIGLQRKLDEIGDEKSYREELAVNLAGCCAEKSNPEDNKTL
jgi:hypothetical protein